MGLAPMDPCRAVYKRLEINEFAASALHWKSWGNRLSWQGVDTIVFQPTKRYEI
jgi:hypothetical protein